MLKEQVSFLSQGQRMEGSLFLPENLVGATGAVVFLHGMTSSEKNYIPIAEKLADIGLVGLTVNLRGHGSSEGEFNKLTVNNGVEDAIAVYDFLSNLHFVDQNRIGVCGGSLGGALGVLLLEHRKLSSLVLRAPALYSPEMMGMTYKQIMDSEANIFNKISDLTTLNGIKNIQNFTGSLLIVASEKDEVIPKQIPQAYFDNAKNAKEKDLVIIKNATHQLTDPAWQTELADNAVSWFEENL